MPFTDVGLHTFTHRKVEQSGEITKQVNSQYDTKKVFGLVNMFSPPFYTSDMIHISINVG